MYGDTSFPPNDSSLYLNPLEPPDYAENCPNLIWQRPNEINQSKDGEEDKPPQMIKDGFEPGDVKQG